MFQSSAWLRSPETRSRVDGDALAELTSEKRARL